MIIPTLQVTPQQLNTLRHHAEITYPQECCGLLIGTLKGDHKILVEIQAVENAWRQEAPKIWPGETHLTQEERYAIAPTTLLATMKAVRNRNLVIIGIYHSHPDHPAIPSEFDRAYAWSYYSYLIIAVEQGKAIDIQSWSLTDDHQFQREEVRESI